MIGSARLSHLGMVVPDLEAAMAEHRRLLGLSWPEIKVLEDVYRLPDGATRTVPLRVVFSREGPPYLELIEAVPGTPWTVPSGGGLHHVAYWSETLLEDVATFVEAGLDVELTRAGPEIAQGFSYRVCESGTRVELIDVAARPAIEAWTGTSPGT